MSCPGHSGKRRWLPRLEGRGYQLPPPAEAHLYRSQMEWTNAAGCWIDGRRVSFRAYAYQETGLGSGERMGCAEGEVCPTNSFPALMLRPGLETRETRGTRASFADRLCRRLESRLRIFRRGHAARLKSCPVTKRHEGGGKLSRFSRPGESHPRPVESHR